MRVADGNRDRDRQAPLPGTTVRAVGDDLRGGLAVGVRQNHDVIFRAALALHAFSVGRGARVDVAGHWRRADKADRLDGRVIEQRIHRRLATIHQIQHTLGHACAVD